VKPEGLILSTLPKTWLLDLDGTLLRHNGYMSGGDEFLPGALKFLHSIPRNDFVLILTAREQEARERTEEFLRANRVRYDLILFEMPVGERVLFNDSKPSGLKTAYAVECTRDEGLEGLTIVTDPARAAWTIQSN
jgi:ribonucleotide monophosphatase NagD (HAD superfamily)